MNKQLNAKLGLILVSLVLILAIFGMMILNGSVAWFADNRDVDALGFKINVNRDVAVKATLHSYPITDIDSNNYTVSFDSERFIIPTDDPNNISYDAYKKALLIVINIDAHEATQNLLIEINTASGLEQIGENDNRVSNCISISPATLSSEGTIAVRGTPSYSFVDLSQGTPVKTDSIDLVRADVPVGETKFYFIIEYNRTLLNYIGEQIMANHPDQSEVIYSDDIEFHVYE